MREVTGVARVIPQGEKRALHVPLGTRAQDGAAVQQRRVIGHFGAYVHWGQGLDVAVVGFQLVVQGLGEVVNKPLRVC